MAEIGRCNLNLLLLVSLIGGSIGSAPVLIWESTATSGASQNNDGSASESPVPALGLLDTEEFTSRLVRKVHLERPLIVLFLEESLSVEDLAWRGAFPQLRNITSMSAQSEFLFAVEDPLASIKDMADSQGYTWKMSKAGKVPPTIAGTLLEVQLSEPLGNEDRPRMLLRHDADIATLYSKLLAGSSHVLAIFTGRQTSWVEPESGVWANRARRQAETISPTEGEAGNITSSVQPPSQEFVFNSENMALLYSSKYPILYDGNETYPLENKSTDIRPDHRETLLRVTTSHLVGNKKLTLRFRFERTASSWQLREVEYSKGPDRIMLTANQDIGAPMNVSYWSSGPVEFTNGSVRLYFKNLQVQPWVYSSRFGNPVDPDTFFTIPIWSAIFVTFILALIFTWAITMLMDIKTMDRFDDPKGKTISVSVSE